MRDTSQNYDLCDYYDYYDFSDGHDPDFVWGEDEWFGGVHGVDFLGLYFLLFSLLKTRLDSPKLINKPISRLYASK